MVLMKTLTVNFCQLKTRFFWSQWAKEGIITGLFFKMIWMARYRNWNRLLSLVLSPVVIPYVYEPASRQSYLTVPIFWSENIFAEFNIGLWSSWNFIGAQVLYKISKNDSVKYTSQFAYGLIYGDVQELRKKIKSLENSGQFHQASKQENYSSYFKRRIPG